MKIPFYKLQGTGNDFVLIDSNDLPVETVVSDFARHVCQRYFGIGADGLLLRYDSTLADHRMAIFNADGSEAEMCGNGLRCFIRYLVDIKDEKRHSFQIETLSGLIHATLHSSGKISVNMGKPILEATMIPALGFSTSPVIQAPLQVEHQTFYVTLVSMGNPHCVIFVRELSHINLAKLGSIIEKLPVFPKGTNVEFVQVSHKKRAHLMVWERGVGQTLACGTGACATVVAGVLTDHLDPEAEIALPGGSLTIQWDQESQCVFMAGLANCVFGGSFLWNESITMTK